MFTFVKAERINNTLYIVGSISESDLDKVDSVGFGAGKSEETAKRSTEKWRETAVVARSVSVDGVEIQSQNDGEYYAAFSIADINNASDSEQIYIVPFVTQGETTTYGKGKVYTVREALINSNFIGFAYVSNYCVKSS